MTYAKAFFDLQLRFAHRVSVVGRMPLPRALLEYTNLYVRFGLGRDFDPGQATWQQYLAGLGDARDAGEWTYRFYLSRPATSPVVVGTFGCFSYARLPGDRIRLHFQNTETQGRSPLARACLDRRLDDLRALFGNVKRTLGERPTVVGVSWLYNLEAYRRLFPGSYVATARPLGGRFRYMPLWGQFLDRNGEAKEDMAREFVARLERQSSLDALEECFPLQVLGLEASVRDFYGLYSL